MLLVKGIKQGWWVLAVVGVLVAPAAASEGQSSWTSSNGTSSSWAERGAPLLDLSSNHVKPDTPFEFNWRTGGSLALACMCALLANAAGVGGGPFYVPLFNSALGFDLKAATALSHCVVATSAVASTLYGVWQTSPNDPSRTLVDFDLAICFLPALLFGVSFGVLLNVLVPEWLQTALLTIILCVVVKHTAHKGFEQRRKELQLESRRGASRRGSREDKEEDPESSKSRAEQTERSLSDHRLEHADEAQDASASVIVIDNDGLLVEEKFVLLPDPEMVRRRSFVEEVQGLKDDIKVELSYIREFWRRFPLGQVILVLLLWGAFLIFQELKSIYKRCTWENSFVYALQLTGLLIITVAAIAYQIRKSRLHPEQVDPELQHILQNSRNQGGGSVVQTFSVVAFVMALSGFTAGFLGIGGALMFNPYLLALGVHPQVTASTAVMMILFSSSSISLSLAFQGLLNHSYARIFAPACFASSLVGVTIINRIVRNSGRTSIIVFILTGLIIVGTITTAVFGGSHAYEDFKHGRDLWFKPFCPQAGPVHLRGVP